MYKYHYIAPLQNYASTRDVRFSDSLSIKSLREAEKMTLPDVAKKMPNVKYENHAIHCILEKADPEPDAGVYLEDARIHIERVVTTLRLLKPQVTGYNAIVHPFNDDWQSFHASTWQHYELWVSPHAAYREEQYTLNDSEVEQLIQLHAAIPESSFTALELAVQYFNKSYIEPYTPRDSLLDLVVALENLYLNGANQELGYQLRTKAAVVLSNLDQPKERKQIFIDIRKAYNQRSCIVHGTKAEVIDFDFMLAIREYTRRSLLVFLAHPELRGQLDDVVLKGQRAK